MTHSSGTVVALGMVPDLARNPTFDSLVTHTRRRAEVTAGPLWAWRGPGCADSLLAGFPPRLGRLHRQPPSSV